MKNTLRLPGQLLCNEYKRLQLKVGMEFFDEATNCRAVIKWIGDGGKPLIACDNSRGNRIMRDIEQFILS